MIHTQGPPCLGIGLSDSNYQERTVLYWAKRAGKQENREYKPSCCELRNQFRAVCGLMIPDLTRGACQQRRRLCELEPQAGQLE